MLKDKNGFSPNGIWVWGIIFIVLALLATTFFFIKLGLFSIAKTGDWKLYSFESSTDDFGTYMTLQAAYAEENTFNNAQCSAVSSVPIDEKITWKTGADNYQESGQGIVVYIGKDLPIGEEILADYVQITGASGAYRACTGYSDRGAVPVSYRNLSASCIANSESSITCTITGEAYNVDGKDIANKLIGKPEVTISVSAKKIPSMDDTQQGDTEESSYDVNSCSSNTCSINESSNNNNNESEVGIWGRISAWFGNLFRNWKWF